MTNKSVYEFEDYKALLNHLEQVRAHIVRGFRSRLAEQIGCNSGFVSQVLNTGAHFSLEQALKISHYLNFSGEEEHYFLLLVENARAGTAELKRHFKRQMDDLKSKYLNISGRVKQQTILSSEAQATYYSQWFYAAIHMLVTVPGFRSIPEIAKALKLNNLTVEKTVTFLLATGLVTEKNEELLTGPSHLHLERNSPNINKHHINWRMAAINSLQNDDKEDIHYSTVSTLSKKDVEEIRLKCVGYIEEYVRTVSRSKEEMLYCFNLDFFKLMNG